MRRFFKLNNYIRAPLKINFSPSPQPISPKAFIGRIPYVPLKPKISRERGEKRIKYSSPRPLGERVRVRGAVE
jgi:hypothetical protein